MSSHFYVNRLVLLPSQRWWVARKNVQTHVYIPLSHHELTCTYPYLPCDCKKAKLFLATLQEKWNGKFQQISNWFCFIVCNSDFREANLPDSHIPLIVYCEPAPSFPFSYCRLIVKVFIVTWEGVLSVSFGWGKVLDARASAVEWGST